MLKRVVMGRRDVVTRIDRSNRRERQLSKKEKKEHSGIVKKR